MRHMAQKLQWAEEGRMHVDVVGLEQLDAAGATQASSDPGLVLLVNVPASKAQPALRAVCATPGARGGNVLVLSPPSAATPYPVASELAARHGQDSGAAAETVAKCHDLWSRDTPEDALYAILFAMNFAVAPMRFVARKPGVDTPEKVLTLCTRCLKEAIAAVLDPNARECLACQAQTDPRDQTQMYRATVTYESDPLASLVRCFERRGIFDCGAELPHLPEFAPMPTFRGAPLTKEAAWLIMEGHWASSECSWRPVLGQNPAYDYFPSQFNSWYRDPKGDRGWYDPVFKVVTLDGSEVWRKRHYRVRVGADVGSFELSTEDNGISLREFWRIVDARDDLGWVVMHYAGAAPAVGQSYSGSLLLTRMGQAPEAGDAPRIRAAFLRSGVAHFELYGINQELPISASDPPPLTDVRALSRYAAR